MWGTWSPALASSVCWLAAVLPLLMVLRWSGPQMSSGRLLAAPPNKLVSCAPLSPTLPDLRGREGKEVEEEILGARSSSYWSWSSRSCCAEHMATVAIVVIFGRTSGPSSSSIAEAHLRNHRRSSSLPGSQVVRPRNPGGGRRLDSYAGLVLSQVIYILLWQIVGIAIFTMEQDQNSKFSCTRLCWYDDMHGVDTVPVVRVDPPVVDDYAIVEVPQIQQQGHLSWSSVMDIQYLQLCTPLPQLQTPDRLSGEPPAGHQLVCSIEAFEDCSCGTFGSGLSTDGRSPCGSSCSLWCRNHVLLSSLRGLCHFLGLYLALFFRAMMYFVR